MHMGIWLFSELSDPVPESSVWREGKILNFGPSSGKLDIADVQPHLNRVTLGGAAVRCRDGVVHELACDGAEELCRRGS